MSASWRSVALPLLLLHLFSSGHPSPAPSNTPAPAPPLQMSAAASSAAIAPSVASPSPSPRVSSDSGESADGGRCPLTVTPSALVVRFGDPVAANCSVSTTGFSLLGWVVSQAKPEPTMARFLVWSVTSMTDWGIQPVCFALAEQGGPCQLRLPLVVYKPPDDVSISFDNHTGPMTEGHRYTLLCTVRGVAPAEHLTVTFYKAQTRLAQARSNNTAPVPVTEVYRLGISPSKEDDGARYWCEAQLELGPAGPQHPLVAVSPNLTATVHFGPQLACATKLWVKEGEALRFEVGGNPPPRVRWYRDGESVMLPAHLRRPHAGRYTVLAEGFLGQKNFTVEVEVLPNRGAADTCSKCFLLGALLTQTTHWL